VLTPWIVSRCYAREALAKMFKAAMRRHSVIAMVEVVSKPESPPLAQESPSEAKPRLIDSVCSLAECLNNESTLAAGIR
jgi:hypothetical protein